MARAGAGAVLGWIDRAVVARVVDALGLAAAFVVGAIALAIGADVVMRAAGLRPLGWTLEMSEYGLLVVCFGGAPWVLRHGDHIRVDVVLRGLAPPARRRLTVAADGLAALACVALAWFGAGAAWDAFARGAVLRKAIDVPQGAVLAAMPVGMALLAWEFARRVLRPPPAATPGGEPAL